MPLFTKNSISATFKTCLLLVGLLVSGGCSEKIEPQPLTYTQLLTGKESKTWKLSSFQVIDQGQIFTAGIQNCYEDDVYVFYANEKKYEVQEGASKCNPPDPDSYVESTWDLVNATATVSFPLPFLSGSDSIPFTIKQLTETSLTVEYFFQDINASYRFIFTAQKAG